MTSTQDIVAIGPNARLNIPQRRVRTHSEVEIEAESVAYLVCERNNTKSKSESYLSHFVKDGVKADSLDLYQITRAAGQIESILKLTMHTKVPPSKKRKLKSMIAAQYAVACDASLSHQEPF